MSMNLHVSAERMVTVNKTEKQSKQTCYFPLWQTPTGVTRAILSSLSPKAAYIAWVMTIAKDEVEPIYAKDDIWAARAPIGTRVVNDGKDHATELIEWLAECEAEGYDIEFYEM